MRRGSKLQSLKYTVTKFEVNKFKTFKVTSFKITFHFVSPFIKLTRKVDLWDKKYAALIKCMNLTGVPNLILTGQLTLHRLDLKNSWELENMALNPSLFHYR